VIVPGNNVAGVHLLMSAAGVEHVLGRPRAVRTGADGARRLDYGRTKVYISATGDGSVFRIITTDRRQRTATHVGVGSSRAAVLRGVPGARCAATSCAVGTKRVTRFGLRDGRVVRVTLAFAGA
jgi:hypothetical protein